MTKLIAIPLRDFALPAPRSGSIETHSGYGRQAAEGQEIHTRVQRQRAQADPAYQAEVAISGLFERGGYAFRVDGRMDGIFRHDAPRIEEIKSTFNIRELAQHLAAGPMDHPYCLQLLTYGYCYWREHRVMPALSFHLVSTRSGDSIDQDLVLDTIRYEQWLERRLDELAAEAQQAEKRALRRRKVASAFTFPFASPRPGQVELMATIERFMAEKRPMLIQAPTGLGKTVGVLYPVMKEALGRGQRVVYVTPKNSQHSVAEDAVTRFQEAGAKLKSLSITAKGKICFMNEPVCNPASCEYARDYYGKVHGQGLLQLLARKRRLTARTFRNLGERYRVCPFELQLDSAREADIIICDYNYVFAPRSALGRVADMGVDQTGRPNLVIDEAHNLPARAMEYYSPALSSAVLEQMRGEIRALPPPFRHEAEALLDGCLQAVAACRPPQGTRPQRIEPPTELFYPRHARLGAFLSRYLDSGVEIPNQDVILRLCHYWGEFTEALEFVSRPERQEFFTTFHPQASGGLVKITCCDASAMLEDCYGDYEQVVGFSATLKPFDYYVRLSGLNRERVRTAEFASPFPKERRKLLIIPQISTRYSRRERNYARIAEAVRRITALRRGNYFVFLPSFEFLERVASLFEPPAGFAVVRQERGMRASGIAAVVENLRSQSTPTIVFAVQGGSFSEGMDYAGEMVIGAFVVGPPLPTYDLEREQMRAYYQQKYAAGFDYAYTIPAMAKAVQAAGRVIRSETDRGLVVLMDGRFLEPAFSQAMPADWFTADTGEAVSGSILREVADFWGSGAGEPTAVPPASPHGPDSDEPVGEG
ncbi:ATP-dependent DNA helicase [Geobacter sp. FeAm09]|uniref:ATP-dependent DNA helicase n=1 Tax=Geobacter sp. FeAm09 TaxID=2597769 RepID=UPI0011EF4F63|nr:ATP-dependent DNA helicase [Geobacter sp. FeAm09]QEM68554.1 ATP-dependent DNA helicase [Geobacter sp. FeAm09]